jgi:hypothetical protein
VVLGRFHCLRARTEPTLTSTYRIATDPPGGDADLVGGLWLHPGVVAQARERHRRERLRRYIARPPHALPLRLCPNAYPRAQLTPAERGRRPAHDAKATQASSDDRTAAECCRAMTLALRLERVLNIDVCAISAYPAGSPKWALEFSMRKATSTGQARRHALTRRQDLPINRPLRGCNRAEPTVTSQPESVPKAIQDSKTVHALRCMHATLGSSAAMPSSARVRRDHGRSGARQERRRFGSRQARPQSALAVQRKLEISRTGSFTTRCRCLRSSQTGLGQRRAEPYEKPTPA